MSDNGLVFIEGELPPEPPRHSTTAERGQTLKANKGQWAKWPAKSTPQQVQESLNNQCGLGYEVTTRRIDGKRVIFARFVGAGAKPYQSSRPHIVKEAPCQEEKTPDHP